LPFRPIDEIRWPDSTLESCRSYVQITMSTQERWPGMDRERAARRLNGVYLQGGLMVLQTQSAARNSNRGRLRGWWRAGR
jgi:hypothetical protein